jgi:hypothetical protein
VSRLGPCVFPRLMRQDLPQAMRDHGSDRHVGRLRATGAQGGRDGFEGHTLHAIEPARFAQVSWAAGSGSAGTGRIRIVLPPILIPSSV